MSRQESAMEMNDDVSIELISNDIIPSTPDMGDLKRDNTVLCSTPIKEVKRIKTEDPMNKENDCKCGDCSICWSKKENKENEVYEVDEEFEAGKDFYKLFKGFNKYDITEQNYFFWRKTAGVGKYYKEYIQSVGLKLILIQVVNERKELAKLFDFEENNVKDKRMNLLLKYVKKTVPRERGDFDNATPEFLEFKKNCHIKRIGYLKFFLKEKYDLDFSKFKSYYDVKWFMRNKPELFE